MEQIVEELKKIIQFKDDTEIGDIVLVLTENPQAVVYALVRNFERDTTRRDEWWHVSMQLLTLPVQSVTWTLRKEQFTGCEIFTMGGDKRFIKAVDLGSPPYLPGEKDKKKDRQKGPALKVVK
ncbi:MAG: hypothetical protein KKG47_15915 [Proteobacteria bacterium]|nr:hypothetical protein [Pseudomonadota bacterium]MBU1739562.1 hypothetical protein [Pseudomonadota bacterium]